MQKLVAFEYLHIQAHELLFDCRAIAFNHLIRSKCFFKHCIKQPDPFLRNTAGLELLNFYVGWVWYIEFREALKTQGVATILIALEDNRIGVYNNGRDGFDIEFVKNFIHVHFKEILSGVTVDLLLKATLYQSQRNMPFAEPFKRDTSLL